MGQVLIYVCDPCGHIDNANPVLLLNDTMLILGRTCRKKKVEWQRETPLFLTGEQTLIFKVETQNSIGFSKHNTLNRFLVSQVKTVVQIIFFFFWLLY